MVIDFEAQQMRTDRCTLIDLEAFSSRKLETHPFRLKSMSDEEDSAATGPVCAQGHPFAIGPSVSRFVCDECRIIYAKDTPAASCRVCDSAVCGQCWRYRSAAAKAGIEVAAVDDPCIDSWAHVVEVAGRKVVNWRRVRPRMPIDRGGAHGRLQMFQMFGPNDEGCLTFFEVDRGLRDATGIDEI